MIIISTQFNNRKGKEELAIFGEQLKVIRRAKGLTLEKLAQRYNNAFSSGLNKGTLSKYENGKQEPMITVVNNLASLFDVSTDCLLGKEFEKTKENENSKKYTNKSNIIPSSPVYEEFKSLLEMRGNEMTFGEKMNLIKMLTEL